MKRIDLNRIKTTSIKKRHSKVSKQQVCREIAHAGLGKFVDSLPDLLRSADLKILISKLQQARKRRKPIIWMFGAHLVKVGLTPILNEVISAEFAQQISTNNAGLIHDLELAFYGHTSENVEESLLTGEFGMTQETAEHYAALVALADSAGIGLGEAAGCYISDNAPQAGLSVFATAYQKQIAATVHVAIGADIVNCHPSYDGAAVGAASQLDFKLFCETTTHLKNGGVVLNFGSAVLMPEVFLKAMSVARNLDPKFTKFTTANFDMITHYRPRQSLVNRPRLLGAESFDFAGHHEIMLPLLWAALKDKVGV
ncbi:MAG: hypothetical protein ABIJ61_07530 [bacterium]